MKWKKDMEVVWKHTGEKGKVVGALETHVRIAWSDGSIITYETKEADETIEPSKRKP